jgi:hypothetical protein
MQVRVVQPVDHRFKKLRFRGYKDLARQLEIGEKVMVAVYGPKIGKFGRIFEGYGEVERLSEDSFSRPRRLMHEY